MRFVTTTALGALLAVSLPASADVVVNISKSQQRMAVVVDGKELYRWPVSTGRPGYETPDGVFHAKSMNREWYSRQYDMTPMPWSVFFYQGYALHGTLEASHLGHAASHGCVRLDTEDASILFALVQEQGLDHTKVVISGRPLPRPRKTAPMVNRRAPARIAESGDDGRAPVKEAKPLETPPAAKADRTDVVAAAKTDRAAIAQPAADVDRADKAGRENKSIAADKAESKAAAPPAEPAKTDGPVAEPVKSETLSVEPAPQEAKLADAAPREIRLSEPLPPEARQGAPVEHETKSAEPAKLEAPPAEPAPQETKLAEAPTPEIILPRPAPAEARPGEPVQHEAKLVAPAKAEAPPAAPVTVDIVLPRPAPAQARIPEPAQAKASHRNRGEQRYSSARGDDAEVLRERAAWLRSLARKYGFNEW